MKWLICWLFDHKYIDIYKSPSVIGDTPNEEITLHCLECLNCNKRYWEFRSNLD